jgi:uncharacterized protein (DUF433 family)
VLHVYLQIARRCVDLHALLGTALSERNTQRQLVDVKQVALPRATIQALIDGYHAGESTYRLAERFGILRNTVRDALRRHGVAVSGAKVQLLSEDDKAEIRERRQLGETIAALAYDFAVSPITIRRALR